MSASEGDEAAPARPVATVAAWVCGVAVLAVVVAAGVRMSLVRGPWIDEFSTLWMSEPGVPLRSLIADRLAFDVHPPFYILALRGVRELWRGATLPGLRLLNLIPLALWAAYAGWAWLRRPAHRGFVAAAFVFSLGAELLGGALPILRPYFALDCLADLFALGAALLYLDLRAGRRLARTDLAVAGLSLLALMNGHYLAAYEMGLLAIAFAAALALHGRRREAGLVVAASALAFAPSLAFLAWRRAYLAGWTGGGFWIRTTTRDALSVMGWFLLRMTGFNLIAYAGALALATARRSGADRPMREVAVVCLSAVAIALAGLLLINLQTNIVVERYLTFLGGPLAVALAAGTARWGAVRPWLYAAALGFSLAAGGRAAWLHAHTVADGWTSTARLVAADVKACPAARVDTFHWSDRYFKPLPTDPPVRDYAYAYLAREFGFAPALNRPLSSTDPACPRILWGEHLGPALGLPTETQIMLKLLSGRNPIPPVFIRPDLEVERGESGYVLKTPPGKPHP